MDQHDARQLARHLMNEFGLYDWTFTFDRAKQRYGACRFGRKTISLSLPLTLLNTREHVEDTIRHEIAHALVGPKHGHKAIWKAMAVRCGAKPERCAPVDSKGLPSNSPLPVKFHFYCRQCNRYIVRKRVTRYVRLMLAGKAKYRCGVCYTDLEYTKLVRF